MTKLVIQNGRVIDAATGLDETTSVWIEKGKIKKVGARAPDNAKSYKVLDAKGCIVSPGFIDLHTHLREPGFEYRETIATGTRSAAAGGFTSVCCMANTNPVNDQASVTEFILKEAQKSGVVNVFPIGALTKGLEGKELAQIGDLKQAGCVALSDDGKCVSNSALMRMAMEYAKSFDLPVITHSVCPDLTGRGVMNESITSTKLGLEGIPNQAEDIMIARDIYLAELTGARLHIAHIATKGGVELVEQAKKKGLPVTCEVTPHHFTLTDVAVCGYHTHAKMAPPLRSEKDRVALVKALKNETIDAVATDHAPHAPIDKEVEFDHAECGVVGLETALSLGLRLVEKNKLPLLTLLKSLTINPAKIVGLDKGTLKEGADADVVVFNTDKEYTVDPNFFYTKSNNSPFDGMKLKGQIEFTLVNGKVVYRNHYG